MKKINIFKPGLGARIYLSMITLIFISLIVTGVATIYYFKSENDRYHLERLQRQENSIILSLNYFTIDNDIDELSPNLENKIHRIAEINNLDLNVYLLSGELIGSTISDSFDEAEFSPRLSDSLVNEILQQGHLIIQEKIDDQSFLSTYFILDDKEGKPLAVINLPYRKTNERLQSEVTSFLITLSEIYLILFAGSGLLAYLLSGYITKSLNKISEKLKEVRINKKNEPIKWEGNDEIAELVDDYNKMLMALEESAKMLAESERESAWKEMARQVAHEIKNPLTPMRLSIQHMNRLAKSPPEDFDRQLERFSDNLLRQIDTLSHIAGAFADFAKMPAANPVKVDVHRVIESVISMSPDDTTITFKPDPDLAAAFVLADESQLVRIFNNLITNSLQAVPEDREPMIMIRTRKEDSFLHISVEDNGSGIPEELHDKIFKPNFTTKSGGMGLGLAMVKNMVAANNGNITFRSRENEGACFDITLRLLFQ